MSAIDGSRFRSRSRSGAWACLGKPIRRRVTWRGTDRDEGPRGESLLAPRRDLREHHLPWAILSFPRPPGPGKRLRPPLVISACGAACSRGASGAFGRPTPRAGTAVMPVGGTPSGGGGGGPAGPGGPAPSARLVGASSRGDTGGASLWSFCPNRSSGPVRSRPHHPPIRPPSHAWASAQRQSLTIFRPGGAHDPAATWSSPSARPGRRSGSVRAAAGGRCATCWIVKPVTGSGGAPATVPRAGDPGRPRRGRRDVFTDCGEAFASG